jgi:DNA polymerase-1
MQQLLDGADIHTANANLYFCHRPDFKEKFGKYRKIAKGVTFGCLYGAGKNAIAAQAEISVDEADRIHKIFWNTYSGLRDYGYSLSNKIKNDGFIQNPFGRKYMTHPDLSYKALNYMVQGSASEVLKRAIINTDLLYSRKYPGCQILMPIHDEIVSEIPARYHSKKLMQDIVVAMQGNFHTYFQMPNLFNIGMSFTSTNWSEKEDFKL